MTARSYRVFDEIASLSQEAWEKILPTKEQHPMIPVKTIWSTNHADDLLAYMARVSNPEAKPDDPAERLIGYLIRKKHWSPFDMVNLCVEVNTTRDIGRQVLRHWSIMMHDLKAQEFSQRYADVTKLDGPILREARLQDHKNRQSSHTTDDTELQAWWRQAQEEVWGVSERIYREALLRGIAKEQARASLPEGLTPTRFYLNGTARQWIHYLELRTDVGTQKEHRDVAHVLDGLFREWVPVTYQAVLTAATRRTRVESLGSRVLALLDSLDDGRRLTEDQLLARLQEVL